jgi:hypothetical protein
MMRNAVRSTPGASRAGDPTTSKSTASPAPRTWSSTPSSSASDADGAVSSRSAGLRSTPSRRRSSVRAARAVSLMISAELLARSG